MAGPPSQKEGQAPARHSNQSYRCQDRRDGAAGQFRLGSRGVGRSSLFVGARQGEVTAIGSRRGQLLGVSRCARRPASRPGCSTRNQVRLDQRRQFRRNLLHTHQRLVPDQQEWHGCAAPGKSVLLRHGEEGRDILHAHDLDQADFQLRAILLLHLRQYAVEHLVAVAAALGPVQHGADDRPGRGEAYGGRR